MWHNVKYRYLDVAVSGDYGFACWLDQNGAGKTNE